MPQWPHREIEQCGEAADITIAAVSALFPLSYIKCVSVKSKGYIVLLNDRPWDFVVFDTNVTCQPAELSAQALLLAELRGLLRLPNLEIKMLSF